MYAEWFQYGLDKIISQGQPVFHWSDKTRGDNQQNDQRQHFFHFSSISMFALTSTVGLRSVQSNYFSL